jgi:hypothetical protein
MALPEDGTDLPCRAPSGELALSKIIPDTTLMEFGSNTRAHLFALRAFCKPPSRRKDKSSKSPKEKPSGARAAHSTINE